MRPAVRPWTARAGRGSCSAAAAAAAKEDSAAAASAARRVGSVGAAGDVVVVRGVVVARGVVVVRGVVVRGVDRQDDDEGGASAALFASSPPRPFACAAAAHVVLTRGRAAKLAAECIEIDTGESLVPLSQIYSCVRECASSLHFSFLLSCIRFFASHKRKKLARKFRSFTSSALTNHPPPAVKQHRWAATWPHRRWWRRRYERNIEKRERKHPFNSIDALCSSFFGGHRLHLHLGDKRPRRPCFLLYFHLVRVHEIEAALPEWATEAHNLAKPARESKETICFFSSRCPFFSAQLSLDLGPPLFSPPPKKKPFLRRSSTRRASTSPPATSAPTSSSRSTSAAARASTCPGRAGRRGTRTKSASTSTIRGGSLRRRKKTRQRRKSRERERREKECVKVKVFFLLQGIRAGRAGIMKKVHSRA